MEKVMNKCELDHFLFLRGIENYWLNQYELEIQDKLFSLYWNSGEEARDRLAPMRIAADELRRKRSASGWTRS
jgi:hypothetical protein